MNLILCLFIFLTITVVIAWLGKYRVGIGLFITFLGLMGLVFAHHVTSHLPINL